MNSSPKENTVVTLHIQIIGIRIHWQVFLALGMIGKIPVQIRAHNTNVQISVHHNNKLNYHTDRAHHSSNILPKTRLTPRATFLSLTVILWV